MPSGIAAVYDDTYLTQEIEIEPNWLKIFCRVSFKYIYTSKLLIVCIKVEEFEAKYIENTFNKISRFTKLREQDDHWEKGTQNDDQDQKKKPQCHIIVKV